MLFGLRCARLPSKPCAHLGFQFFDALFKKGIRDQRYAKGRHRVAVADLKRLTNLVVDQRSDSRQSHRTLQKGSTNRDFVYKNKT